MQILAEGRWSMVGRSRCSCEGRLRSSQQQPSPTSPLLSGEISTTTTASEGINTICQVQLRVRPYSQGLEIPSFVKETLFWWPTPRTTRTLSFASRIQPFVRLTLLCTYLPNWIARINLPDLLQDQSQRISSPIQHRHPYRFLFSFSSHNTTHFSLPHSQQLEPFISFHKKPTIQFPHHRPLNSTRSSPKQLLCVG